MCKPHIFYRGFVYPLVQFVWEGGFNAFLFPEGKGRFQGEAVFAGPAAAVDEMIDACRQGPPGARVEAIDQRDGTADDMARRRPGDLFSVLPTA